MSRAVAIAGLTIFQTSPVFMCLQYKSFKNTVGKGEIARDEHCFPHVRRTFRLYHQI